MQCLAKDLTAEPKVWGNCNTIGCRAQGIGRPSQEIGVPSQDIGGAEPRNSRCRGKKYGGKEESFVFLGHSRKQQHNSSPR